MANPEQCSLREFVNTYSTMQRNEQNIVDDQWAFLHSAQFALTGRVDLQQYAINALQNRFDAEHDTPAFKRDYDSLIGFTPSIPVSSDIYILPLSSARDVLTESLHVKVNFRLPPNRVRCFLPRQILHHPDLLNQWYCRTGRIIEAA